MMRLACLLGLLAIAALVLVCVRTDGASAIVFCFLGVPALALALAVYGLSRLRAGAFRAGGRTTHPMHLREGGLHDTHRTRPRPAPARDHG